MRFGHDRQVNAGRRDRVAGDEHSTIQQNLKRRTEQLHRPAGFNTPA